MHEQIVNKEALYYSHALKIFENALLKYYVVASTLGALEVPSDLNPAQRNIK